MGQLTEHFTEEELNVKYEDQEKWTNARFLCRHILEPIRYHYSEPVFVTSGYRPAAHNAKVGGKPTSWHLYQDGHAAADFFVNGVAITQVFTWLRMVSQLPFDKAILEYKGDVPNIIHVQIDRLVPPRRLAFVGQTGAGVNYQPIEVA